MPPIPSRLLAVVRSCGHRPLRRAVSSICLAITLPGTVLGQRALETSQRHAPQPASAPAGSRLPWALIDAVGYGGAGFGLGFAAAFGTGESSLDEIGDALALIGGGTIAGLIAGGVIGHKASRNVATGRPIGEAHRVATLAGAVLAGGTLGALAAIPLIEGTGSGTPLGSDEQTFAITTGTGIVLGTLFVARYADALANRPVSLAPVQTRDGRLGLRVAMRF